MAFQELKERHSVMWGNGPYQRISETITDIHDVVIERLAPEPGDELLEFACGTGAVAELGAERGAQVTGVDLAPVLIATANEAVARELARVVRPGGLVALANWTPTGGVGKMFKVMAPYQPAPPPSSPFDWGDETRVGELLGESFELELSEYVSTLRFPSGQVH
jgi:Methyltransferase domain